MGSAHSDIKENQVKSPEIRCVGAAGKKRRKITNDANEDKKRSSQLHGEINFEPHFPGKCSFLEMFFRVYNDTAIQGFVWMDKCFVLADNYLLAMVYTYFRRTGLAHDEYTRLNFFAALYLAHDMAEDNEDLKLEIYPWVYGAGWKHLVKDFLKERDNFLRRMHFRVAVSKRTCDEVMKLFVAHPISGRVRRRSHSGTLHFEENVYVKNGMGGVSCVFCVKERRDAALFSDSVSSEGSGCDGSYGSVVNKTLSVADVGLTEVLVC